MQHVLRASMEVVMVDTLLFRFLALSIVGMAMCFLEGGTGALASPTADSNSAVQAAYKFAAQDQGCRDKLGSAATLTDVELCAVSEDGVNVNLVAVRHVLAYAKITFVPCGSSTFLLMHIELEDQLGRMFYVRADEYNELKNMINDFYHEQ